MNNIEKCVWKELSEKGKTECEPCKECDGHDCCECYFPLREYRYREEYYYQRCYEE